MKPAARLDSIRPSLIRQIYQSASTEAINLGLGEIRLPIAPALQDAMQKVVAQPVHTYTANAGLQQLREAVAQRYGMPSFEHVCITSGAEEALYSAIMSYINPGDEVLIADPGFVAYRSIISMAGGRVSTFNMAADFHFDASLFDATINPQTKAIVLCHPSNPTGVAFSSADIDHISRRCSEKGILLIVDEVYRELFISTPIDSFASNVKNCLIIGGISKSFGLTGWRLGWCYSPDASLISPVITTHQYVCTCAATPSQHLALWALSPVGKKITLELRQLLASNRKMLKKKLHEAVPQCTIAGADAHPYLLVHIPYIDDLSFAGELASSGVITVPGSAFGRTTTGWMRLTYALPAAILKRGTERFISGLQQHRKISD